MTLNEFIKDAFYKEHEFLMDAVGDLTPEELVWRSDAYGYNSDQPLHTPWGFARLRSRARSRGPTDLSVN